MNLRNNKILKNVLLFLAVMGPGIITANVGNNSAGIATYSLAGARFGYSLIWSFVPMFFAFIVAQEMCARMAVVTGKGLADLIRENFGVKMTFYFMAVLFLVNLTCLMAEFSGVAASLEIFHISKYFSLPVAACTVWFFVVRGTYKSVEKIFLVMSFFYLAYIISGFLANPDWKTVAYETVVPQMTFRFDFLVMLIGMIGTTIAPWMQFYLQTSIVEKKLNIDEYRNVKWDVIIGCFVALAVAFFIIVACASTLFKAGIHVETVKEAALALKPLAGDYATWLFAFGLFNAALFAVSIMPISTAYCICEGMGWDEGIDKSFKEAPQFYGLFTAMIIIGAGIVLIPNFPLLKMMYFSQVGNGILLPFVLIFMIRLVNNKDIMGEYVNSRAYNIIAWLTVVIMIALSLLLCVLSFVAF